MYSEPTSKHWQVVTNILLQCAVAEPGAMYFIFRQLYQYHWMGHKLPKAALSEMLDTLIGTHSTRGHGSEVAWALWIALVFRLHISQRTAALVTKMKDSVVALLALHAKVLGLIKSTIDTSEWQSLMTTEELYGENWLLAYDANKKRWLRGVGRRDNVNPDPIFKFLKKNGVYFYDEQLATAYFNKQVDPEALVSDRLRAFLEYVMA